jgi:multiple sugar transport system permease protein
MREERVKKLVLRGGIIFIIVFCLFPFLWMLIVSFTESPDFLIEKDVHFSLKNYIALLSLENLHFPHYLKNSLIIALFVSFSSATVSSFAAYAVTRCKFKGRTFLVLSVLALSMVPQISMVGYLFKIMVNIGWFNTYLALIFPYIALSLPLGLWILLSYFSQIPQDLDKAALVDGASRWQILWRIILPVSLPGFLSAVLLIFIFSFNEFLFALMLTADYTARTVPVGIALFEGLHGQIPWGYIMAASVISSFPVIILGLCFQKYIIQGLTGAVKQ